MKTWLPSEVSSSSPADGMFVVYHREVDCPGAWVITVLNVASIISVLHTTINLDVVLVADLQLNTPDSYEHV